MFSSGFKSTDLGYHGNEVIKQTYLQKFIFVLETSAQHIQQIICRCFRNLIFVTQSSCEATHLCGSHNPPKLLQSIFGNVETKARMPNVFFSSKLIIPEHRWYSQSCKFPIILHPSAIVIEPTYRVHYELVPMSIRKRGWLAIWYWAQIDLLEWPDSVACVTAAWADHTARSWIPCSVHTR